MRPWRSRSDLDEFAQRPSAGAHLARRASVRRPYRRRMLRLSDRKREVGPERQRAPAARCSPNWKRSMPKSRSTGADLRRHDRRRHAQPSGPSFSTRWPRYPDLAERMLMLPGNHDLNIVDRANPARMDLPTSPNRRLRQLRVLSAMDELQGDASVWSSSRAPPRQDARGSAEPHLSEMVRFADEASRSSPMR